MYSSTELNTTPNPQLSTQSDMCWHSANTLKRTDTQIYTDSLKTHPGEKSRNSLEECLHILVSKQMTWREPRVRDGAVWGCFSSVRAIGVHPLQHVAGSLLHIKPLMMKHFTLKITAGAWKPSLTRVHTLDTCSAYGMQLPQISVCHCFRS